ncbi:MAG: lysophospholipid acyltransferase family protein [Turicibacter sp.]|nr:lysophospholipid acyltransferase family protein [Turicibacter sp.]
MLNVLWIILGILLAVVILAVVVVLCVNARVQQLKNEKYTNKERFDFISWVVSWAIPLLFNVKVNAKGLEKLEAVEHGVIYANHQSNIDIVTMLKAIKKPHGYVAKKELDNIFLLSDSMRLIQCQFMDRTDVRQSVKVISAAAKSVKEGHLMVIFPEGTRMIQAEIGSFKAGSFKLAQKAKADIIPVTIYNSYEVAKRWPRRTVINMEIHDPIPYETYEALSTNEICEQVEQIIKSPMKK